ncbi:S9 family peptidase [Salinicoccus kekensis]|uniref:S9 family peptidase n=1 Tax=Salinicoccus kekensis TaxID=714307 RepID=UPI000BE33F64|nr:alpha/beta fold hydrolase [Salinicoccus kekensis]
MLLKFKKTAVEQFFTPYSIGDFNITQDEKRLLFSSNMNGKVNIYAMDLPHTYPYQFSVKDESASFIQPAPDNSYVLAGFDKDGNENHKIYAIPPQGGMPEQLIEADVDDKFMFTKLSKDGTKVYYTSSKGNASYLNSYVYDTGTEEEVLLHEGEGGPTHLVDVSQNEENSVYLTAFANTHMIGFIKTEEGTEYLTPDAEKVHTVSSISFVKDDEAWFVTNYDSEYSYLAKYDLTTKSFEKVLDFERESLVLMKYNRHTNMMYLITQKGVVQKLYYYDLNHDQLEPIIAPVTIFDRLVTTRSGALYIKGTSATVPVNIFKYEDETWEQLTKNKVLGVTPKDMVEPETITYKSFDGLEIEALLFRAKEDRANGYTVFWPHGGPQYNESKSFRAMFQMFLNRGYNVFCPNFRGSTGYGAEFVKMVEGDWGHGPRLDNVKGIEWLFQEGISSPEKLFLVGGSYGGYMALLLHGRHPEYFKAVVDIFGVSNLFTFYESVPEHWKPMMKRWVGDPVEDEERFRTDSPVTYLDTMTRPMLVIQGAHDPRVVKEESDQIVEKLRSAGRDVEYIVLDDEGHGFSKKENEILVYEAMLEFLEKHQ